MKPTDVERLSEPLCLELDVRPPSYFHANFTLASFEDAYPVAIFAELRG